MCPHPNSFSDIAPAELLGNLCNGDYKLAAYESLVEQFPEANVIVPYPSYYKLISEDRALKLVVPTVCGVDYTPMASSADGYQRLCHQKDVRCLAIGPNVEDLLKGRVLNMGDVMRTAISHRFPVLFLGEYICTLSFCSSLAPLHESFANSL